jgi:hypothetical protein
MRCDEENDDGNFKESQQPVRDRLWSRTHRYVRQGPELHGYKNIDNVTDCRFPELGDDGLQDVISGS